MAEGSLDVLVVGGGIVGAGTALEAARRGLAVGLVEREDFASGASGRSSRELHGGLQYLMRGDLRFVRTLLRERAAVAALVPYLVSVLPYMVPTTRPVERVMTGAALGLYDSLSAGVRIAPPRRVRPVEAHALTGGVLGVPGLMFYEYAVDDARLTFEVVRLAARSGACVANHVSVVDVIGDGRVRGVVAVDGLTGERCEIMSRVVVNATGAWAQRVSRLAGGHRVRMRPSKGVHLVFAKATLPLDVGIVIPSVTGHGRHFLVPWGDRVYAGTTDTPYAGDPAAADVEDADQDVILGSIASALSLPVSARDVVASWAGVRPLVDAAGGTSQHASRRHLLIEDPPGLLTITGGKLTAFGMMARQCVEEAVRRLGHSVGLRVELSHRVAERSVAQELGSASAAVRRRGLPQEFAHRLVARYGNRWPDALAWADRDSSLAEPLWPGLPVYRVEATMAFQQEMAMTDDDVLDRRTRIATMSREADMALRGQLDSFREPAS